MDLMKMRIVRIVLIVVSIGGLVSCADSTPKVLQGLDTMQDDLLSPQNISDLKGQWEYSDNTGLYFIKLNAQGKGPYEWKEGRFETHSLERGIWTGVWIQEGNDREGGFTLTFSDGPRVAQGEWWYTRIGKEHDPFESGGTFQMSRSSLDQTVP